MPSERAHTSRTIDESGALQPQAYTHVKDQSREKSMNGTLDGWVEPVMPSAKPSFEDHGGAPFGVLEHMQPLGEAPSARVRARVKGDGGRKSMLGRSAASAVAALQETPESTPAPPAPSPVRVEPEPLPVITVDDEDDHDYAPDKKGKKKERAPKPKVSKPPKPEKDKVETAKRARKVVNKNRIYSAAKLKAVVEEAKQRAVTAGKPDLVAAVEEIHRMSLTDRHLTELLEVVLLQKATTAQNAEFADYVKKAKRYLRQHKFEQEARAQPVANGSKSSALPVRSPVKVEPQHNNITSKVEAQAVPSTESVEPTPKSKTSIRLGFGSKAKETRPQEQTEPQGSDTAHMAPVPSSASRAEEEDATSDMSELTELSEDDAEPVDTDVADNAAREIIDDTRELRQCGLEEPASDRLSMQNHNLKRSSAEADLGGAGSDRELAVKKQRLSGRVQREYHYEESNVRTSSGLRNETLPSGARAALVPPRITLRPNGVVNSSARASRAPSTDVDSPLTSPALSSRRGTPHVWKGPAKTMGKRAKTKTSPEKKAQVANTGSLSSGGAGRDSPIGADDNEELSENNDFCASCGGSGFLLCCDGCDRSFHFTCLDPPLNEDASELNEPWFCFSCVAQRPATHAQPASPAEGIFAPLLETLMKSNPSTFSLPSDLQSRYFGVSVGKRGGFVESLKPRARNRGFDDRPDDLKLKDSKGNAVLCYFCGKSSGGKRPIIQCDHCPQSWHLDCLDPPLANPPCRDPMGAKNGDWMCPLHAEHALYQIEVARLAPRRKIAQRRIAGLKPTPTALTRGQLNNGIIDVVEEESEDSDAEFIEEEAAYGQGVMYKLPAQGIKLDFIEKIKQTRALPPEDTADFVRYNRHREEFQEFQEDYDDYRQYKRAKMTDTPQPSQLSQPSFSDRSIRDQQTALLLAQMASKNQDIGLSADRVENLVSALITEAPDYVLDHISELARTNGHGDNAQSTEGGQQFTAEQREDLLRLREIVNRALEGNQT